MDIKKCDRCGNVYRQNSSCNKFRAGGNVEITANKWLQRRYDLCDKCLDEFYGFMKNRGEK